MSEKHERQKSMSAVTKEALQQLFEHCITMVVEDVQKHVSAPLPTRISLGLEAFGQRGKVLSLDEVMHFLYQDGTFPRIVDVAVRGIKQEATLIWLRPSEHAYVSDFSQTWNTPVGMGPFKKCGLILPYSLSQRSMPLSVQDLEEAGEKW